MVYLHKTESMRQGRLPQPWPPDLSAEPALSLLDQSYAGMRGEFAARKPDEPSVTWYEPEQTVGFWIRRMAQETVIHRVDAEQAVAQPLAEIPDDLAVDGIDELLERFLAYGSHRWHEDFAPVLPPAGVAPVLVRAGGRGWLVRADPGGVEIQEAAGADAPSRIGGDPVPMLLWLWRRADAGVTLEGDGVPIERLRTLLREATQ
jgi:hypothetical protein